MSYLSLSILHLQRTSQCHSEDEQGLEVSKSLLFFTEQHQEYVFRHPPRQVVREHNCYQTSENLCEKGFQEKSQTQIRPTQVCTSLNKREYRQSCLPKPHVLQFGISTAQSLFYLVFFKALFHGSVPLGLCWFLRCQTLAHVCMCLRFWRAVLTNVLRIHWHCTETMPKKFILIFAAEMLSPMLSILNLQHHLLRGCCTPRQIH